MNLNNQSTTCQISEDKMPYKEYDENHPTMTVHVDQNTPFVDEMDNGESFQYSSHCLLQVEFERERRR